MKKLLLAAGLAGAVAFIAPAALAQNVAIVNGKAVPSSRVDALALQVSRSGQPITPDIQTKIKEEVIVREIFLQEAEKRGIDATEEFKTQVELARQTLLIRELFNEFQKANPVTDAEVQAEYDKFAAANGGKEYRARHILVEKEDQAKSIIAQIKKGAKFEDLAKKLSKDPASGANGGDLDWANAGSYVKPFSEAMVALTKGKMTETPVKTEFGYHIIRLDDIRPAQLPPVDQLKPQIADQLKQQKLGAYQQELRLKARVE